MSRRHLHARAWTAVAAGLCLALALSCGAGAASKVRPAAGAGNGEAVPAPHQVQSRSGPLKKARTALATFDTAPFPYRGMVPGKDRAFLDVEQDGRRGHTGYSGRVYWEDETFSDRRVLLHIPKGFDVRRPSVMVVFFHGHGATLERDVVARQKVPAQISSSGVNAVLVAPQLAFDAADSSAGNFWTPGGFGRFVGEAAENLAKLHGDPRSVRTFASMPIVIMAYSGGYLPAAASISKGGIKTRLRGVVLLDALYGELDKFATWIEADPSAFFVSAYLGSTREKNAQLERILAEREVSYTTELDHRLGQGGVTILEGGTGVTHRDLVTHAWTDNPIEDILRRLPGFRR